MSNNHSILSDTSDSAELMYVKCATCGKWMDVKPGHINNISHSICPDCFKKEMHKLETESPAPEAV